MCVGAGEDFVFFFSFFSCGLFLSVFVLTQAEPYIFLPVHKTVSQLPRNPPPHNVNRSTFWDDVERFQDSLLCAYRYERDFCLSSMLFSFWFTPHTANVFSPVIKTIMMCETGNFAGFSDSGSNPKTWPCTIWTTGLLSR